MCHGHSGCDSVASLGFASLAEANVHARVDSWFISIIVVGQDFLLELAFIVVVALGRRLEGQTGRKNRKQSFIKPLIMITLMWVFCFYLYVRHVMGQHFVCSWSTRAIIYKYQKLCFSVKTVVCISIIITFSLNVASLFMYYSLHGHFYCQSLI